MLGKKKRNIIYLSVLSLIIGTAMGFARGSDVEDLPTVDDIIQRYIGALGGEENLRAVQSKAMTYKVFMQTMEGYQVTQTVDRKGTLKSQRQGSDRYLFFDGQKLWNINKEEKKELEGKVVDQFRRKANLDGPFLDYKTRGIKVRCLGKMNVEFSSFLEVEATWMDGTRILYYFDQSDGLLKMTKEPSYRMFNGKITEGPLTITYFYDFKKVNGIMIPHLWIQTDGELGHMHLFKVENVMIN